MTQLDIIKQALAKNDGDWRVFRRCALCNYHDIALVRAGSTPSDWRTFAEVELSIPDLWRECDNCGAYSKHELLGMTPLSKRKP
jgi:hypothetical protein